MITLRGADRIKPRNEYFMWLSCTAREHDYHVQPMNMMKVHKHLMNVIVDRKAGKMMCLVMSVCLSVHFFRGLGFPWLHCTPRPGIFNGIALRISQNRFHEVKWKSISDTISCISLNLSLKSLGASTLYESLAYTLKWCIPVEVLPVPNAYTTFWSKT